MKCLLCCTSSGLYRVLRVFQHDAEIRNAFVSFIALQSRQGSVDARCRCPGFSQRSAGYELRDATFGDAENGRGVSDG
jgi:hypothetical protein